MDKIVARWAERMARPSPRRGFLETAVKVMAATAVGGTAFVAAGGVANAETPCCSGSYTCSPSCPPTTCADYANSVTCCLRNGNEYTCTPCKNCSTGQYVCTVVSGPIPNCPQRPAP